MTAAQKELLVVGTSHHLADIGLRERLHVDQQELEALRSALAEEGAEAVVLSTCNRTELYLAHEDPPAAIARARAELARVSALPASRLAPALYTHLNDDAALHLFRVASGFDSLVPGESQILGQVRDAHEAARSAGTVGPMLDRVFRQALEAARRVRPMLPEIPPSIPAAAVQLLAEALDPAAGRRVLLIGAGRMGGLLAEGLTSLEARICLTSRTLERAEDLARRFRADFVDFEAIGAELGRVDAVISSTRCPRVIVTCEQLAEALPRREGRPLLLIDIAVPRDLDPAIRSLPGCSLYDIDDVGKLAGESVGVGRDARDAEALLDGEVARFREWRSSLAVVPAIASLRRRAEQIREGELARSERRLRSLQPEERKAVEVLTAQIVSKLLHEPTVRVKAAGPDGPGYADALQHLFALEEDV